ncbi:MAG: FAD-dependent oxidoreductase [Deltaproteobacteria bacterium]
MKRKNLILGGGMTGLAAGITSHLPVYESEIVPGGICSSYYLCAGDSLSPLFAQPEDGQAYRFEIGGGHWIFGGDPAVLKFIRSLAPTKSYARSSSVYFPDRDLYVPYPIQNHLGYLGKDIAARAIAEIISSPKGETRTMADWIAQSFGRTLTDLFFAPFHELYTAGLWTKIAPQDAYKSPVNMQLAIEGAFDKTPPAVGYNTTYLYPTDGLNALAGRMARRADVRYAKRAARIHTAKREVEFTDGTTEGYDNLISTLPLNKALEISGVALDAQPDSFSSVLVLNIGAKKGDKCPPDHWLYVPKSACGFHRVGFYSNVDSSFLPAASRKSQDRASIYVERAYANGKKPSEAEIKSYSDAVVKELQSWRFIEEAEAVHPTWIEVAYTWSVPGSRWRQRAIGALEGVGIYQIGRYGRWTFQGIAESIRDGFIIGGAMGGAT